MKFGWKYGDDFKEEAFYVQPRIEKYYIAVIQAIFIVFDLLLMCVVYLWPLSLFFFFSPSIQSSPCNARRGRSKEPFYFTHASPMILLTL